MAQTQASQFLATLPEHSSYDVVVLGAGAAGMAAALFAAIAGSKVLLVERTEYVGGTTALSGGTTWVPLTRYLADTTTEDSVEQVMTFLDAAVGVCTAPDAGGFSKRGGGCDSYLSGSYPSGFSCLCLSP